MVNIKKNHDKNSKESADILIAWIREYAKTRIDSRLADERGAFPPHVFLDLGNQGFFGMHVSKKYGGLGLKSYDLLRVIEQVAAIDLTLSILVIEAVQGAHTLENYASENLKNKYLPQLASGRIFVAGAMTESAAGSNPRAMKATATSDGNNGFLLRGSKRWVGMGSWATVIAVYVQEFDAENNWIGMSGFLVPQGAEGLHIAAEAQTMGIKSIGKYTIHLDNVKVTQEALLGCSGDGMEIAQDNMMYIRLCLAAASIGAMKRSAQLMYRYAERRTIATGQLLENPMTIVSLSKLTAVIHGIENLVYLVGDFLDKDPETVPEEALVAIKILASEYLGWTVDKLVQMLGARGYEESNGISKMFRDARTFRIFEGPTEALTMYIGSRMQASNFSFQNFLCNVLQQKELFNEIINVIKEIKQHYQKNKTNFFEKPFLLDYCIQAAVGDIVSHGLLLATMEYMTQKNSSGDNARTLIWAREKFDFIIQKSFTCSPAEKVLIYPEQLNNLISKYENTIGDVEQTRISQEISLDPLLQSHFDVFLENQDSIRLLSQDIASSDQSNRLSKIELQQLLQWAAIEKNSSYPDICVHKLFELQAENTPDSIAVAYHENALSYNELNIRANRLAHLLIKNGISSDKVVAIYLERSVDMIVGVLAILKAGGAYLSLDPHYPAERLQFMLQDSESEIILTQKKLANEAFLENKNIMLMDEIEDLLALESGQNIPSILKTESVAYIIYTSGSTGKSKGVMMPHQALTNLICWHKEKVKGKRNVLQFTTLSFDMSFLEIFSALSSGGTLVLISEQERLDVFSFAKIVKQHKVEQLTLSVPFLRVLAESKINLQHLSTLEEIIVAGEQIKVSLALITFFSQLPKCKLLNYYGPSETHVVTAYEFPNNPANWPSYPPIGRPITHAKILILDENLQQVPIGVTGEIYIGGISLSRGYKNRDTLTQEQFITDIYSENPKDRLYRTGDFAKYLPDGNIIFIGRKDEQVKISGFRIELKEIEAHIAQYTGVKDAVVLVKTNATMQKHLEAFFVSEFAINDQYIEQLRSFLKSQLPAYMVPTVFNAIPQMPLTPSGKVDKMALEKTTSSSSELLDNIQKPVTDTEKKLVEIFEDFFKLSLDLNCSFISMGGNSLLAMSISSKLYEECSVEIPACTILSTPTIAEIAKHIDVLKAEHRVGI
jgi:amino acid adenylation domain-containing protein